MASEDSFTPRQQIYSKMCTKLNVILPTFCHYDLLLILYSTKNNNADDNFKVHHYLKFTNVNSVQHKTEYTCTNYTTVTRCRPL